MQPPALSSRAASRRRSGMTLVEIMVALTVFTVAVYLLSTTITSVLIHAEGKRERTLAVDAAMNQLERMHSEPFGELFALHNGATSDDPDGVGTAPGPHFEVAGLVPVVGDADGLPGRILLPSPTAVLRENAALPELSMPRDLDGDMRIDGEDHSETYIVLPVIVRIDWQGRSGPRSFEISSMFAALEKMDG